MMRVLLVDDDPNKARQIRNFLDEEFADWQVEERRSFQSGLKEALLSVPDFILLDMTMPTYDVSGKETGGIERRYAGTEILRRLQRKGVNIPVIVVTQFERFGEGEELVTLDELRVNLAERFPESFKGAVFYQAANSEWKSELRRNLTDAAFNRREGSAS
jgi:CheY-like chemotaxis protein